MPIHVDPEETRLTLWRNGYKPVPIVTGQKHPTEKNWPTVCRNADETTICSWKKKLPGCRSTGILTGEAVGADIDVLDEPLACVIESVAYETLGRTLLKRVGLAPKRLFVCRTIEPFGKIDSGELYLRGRRHKIEVLGRGQQFVAFGIHPDTQRPYEWIGPNPCDVPLEQLPIVTEAQCREFVSKAKALLLKAGATSKPSSNGAIAINDNGPETAPALKTQTELDDAFARWQPRLNLTAEQMQQILDQLDPDMGRADWIKIGMGLHHETQGDDTGFELWRVWSSGSAKYPGENELRRQWKSFGRSRCPK